ncbi:MAG: ferrous iron transport protein A [Acutalibacteraceae bacterium]
MNELKNGESGYVTVLDTNISLRSRLRELGLIEGTKITKVCTAFPGSPCAYNIRGAIIALRNSDTNDIKVVKKTV